MRRRFYIGWAQINRSALIRIQRLSSRSEKSTRAELRFPASCRKPVSGFHSNVAAALHGIENKKLFAPSR